MCKFLIGAGLACALGSGVLAAGTPADGLGGLAVSPDGATIVAAGDTRVLYVLNASGEVQKRHWTGTTTTWLDYRRDGAALITNDTDGTLQILDAETMETLWSQSDADYAAYAMAVDQLAFVHGKRKERKLSVIDATSFEVLSTHELGEVNPVAVGLSNDGLRVTVLARSEKREAEDKQRAGNELKGVEKVIFNQKHDQRGARIIQINLATAEISTVDSWYKSDNVKGMKVSGAKTYVLSYSNEMAAIDHAGEVEILNSGASNHYGAGMNAKLDTIISGSLKSITLKPLAADAAQVFKLDDLPGWPEYVIRFDTGPDGKIYAGTSAYRLIILDPAAGTLNAIPVH